MKITDLTDKYNELEKYYIEDINVLSWMKDEGDTQKILFSERFEVKKNGKYHNLNGPAVKFKDGSEFYWIDGKLYNDKLEWEQISKKDKRKKIMDKLGK